MTITFASMSIHLFYSIFSFVAMQVVWLKATKNKSVALKPKNKSYNIIMSGNRSRDTHCKSSSRLHFFFSLFFFVKRNRRREKKIYTYKLLPIETSGYFLSSPCQISFLFVIIIRMKNNTVCSDCYCKFTTFLIFTLRKTICKYIRSM